MTGPAVLPPLDTVRGFTIASRNARGRVVRLGPALDAILAAHAYPPVLARLLAEALVLGALLGSTLKHSEGQLTLQAHAQGGVVDLLVVDYRGGEMRGYLRHDAGRLAEAPAHPSLFALFGKGYLAITFDQAPLPGSAAPGERYQGIVPLEGGSLAVAAEHFFAQSEQIPSLVRVAVTVRGDGSHVAGGLLVQHLPEGEEGRDRLHTRLDHPEWEHVEALARTVSPAELTDPALPLDELLWRLFNEADEVRVLEPAGLARGCRCSPDHVRDVIARFPASERAAMIGDDGTIRVDCEFCARSFPVEGGGVKRAWLGFPQMEPAASKPRQPSVNVVSCIAARCPVPAWHACLPSSPLGHPWAAATSVRRPALCRDVGVARGAL